jgi:hypothetical protein
VSGRFVRVQNRRPRDKRNILDRFTSDILGTEKGGGHRRRRRHHR